MAKEFVVCVGQEEDNENFDWVVRGMGKYVHIIRVEKVSLEEMDEPPKAGEGEFLVYHTGPHTAIDSVPCKGFIFPDSPLSDEGEPVPRPWNPTKRT